MKTTCKHGEPNAGADCRLCIAENAEVSSLAEQVGGDHYKEMAIQPVIYIHKNGIGFIEGCVIKYCSRWRSKGGIDDLKKARHFLDMLIEMEEEPDGSLQGAGEAQGPQETKTQ